MQHTHHPHTSHRLSYSPKAARAGKDIGRKGRNFAKIVAAGDKRYGKGHGAKIAGAILRNLRAKYK